MRRETEAMTYNDVIRTLLNLGGAKPVASDPEPVGKSLIFKGVEFPHGTLFRATYKGQTRTATVKDGIWVDDKGEAASSPSQAAYYITGSSVNGWRFWECRRPNDTKWISIDELRGQVRGS
jgi:hypothetical protein